MATSISPITVLIIGNGVAGPVLAMALKQQTPHKVILVDAGPEEALPIGAGLALMPNGLHALKFIGAEHIVLDKGGRFDYMAVRRADTNALLVEQPIQELFTKKYGFSVSLCFARARMCSARLTMLGQRDMVLLGKNIVALYVP